MSQTSELIYFPTWTAGRAGYADRIRQLFQEHHQMQGLRLTNQKNHILDYLLKTDRHLSQEEIYQALKSKGVGRVTVFRTIKMLESLRLIEGVHDSSGRLRYEVNKERPHHDHLICLSCNKIIEIQWPNIEKAQEKFCKQIGFEVSHHRHEIYGRCQECVGKMR